MLCTVLRRPDGFFVSLGQPRAIVILVLVVFLHCPSTRAVHCVSIMWGVSSPVYFQCIRVSNGKRVSTIPTWTSRLYLFRKKHHVGIISSSRCVFSEQEGYLWSGAGGLACFPPGRFHSEPPSLGSGWKNLQCPLAPSCRCSLRQPPRLSACGRSGRIC